MKVTYLTNSQFSKLKAYSPGDNIEYVECSLFMLGGKNKIGTRKLLKKFKINNGDYLGRKLLNINTLADNSEPLLETNRFIIPDTLGIVGGEVIGCTVPFEENSTNMLTVLENPKVKLEEKIELLKNPGEILEILSRLQGFPYKIHLGDLHEGNFIITEDGTVKTVDMDSVYISNNKPFHSKYLFLSSALYDFPHKYKTNEDDDIIPSADSDIYCYIMMILNTISASPIYTIPVSEFYNYMNYLESLEVKKEFLYCIEKIYNGGPNENPLPYLDELPIENLYQAHHLVYKQRTGRNLNIY